MTAHHAGLALKRTLDLLGATLGLVACLPLLAVVACLIRLEDGGPVLYRQPRVGLGLRQFALLKFRSLQVNDLPTDALGQITASSPLVTRTGRLIRRLKVDELPQLLNVLCGDMSLVGPRPTVPEQVARYTPFQRRRVGMRPGMTGWAQVNGNVRLTWDERIVLDVWYVAHWSLLLDARILARTLAVVVLGERPNLKALRQALAYADGSGRRG